MRLFKKLMQFSVGSVIVLILGFISQPIITRIISPVEMGKFSVFNTILSLLMVFIIMGLDQAYGRFFYEENQVDLFRFCIKIPIFTCTCVCAIIAIFYKELTQYLVGESSLLCMIMVVTFLFGNVVYSFQLLYVRMSQQAHKYSLYTVLVKVLYLIFVVVIYKFLNDNYMVLVVATVLSYYCVIMVASIIDKKFYQQVICGEKQIISTQKILKYSIPLILTTALSWLFQSVDKIMIKSFSGYKEVGIYAGAITIVNMLNALQSMFTTFWVPVAFEHYAEYPNDREFYSIVNEVVSFVMLLGATVLISCKDILGYILGTRYSQSIVVFPFLVFMPIMYTISETTVVGINFKEKTNRHIIITLVSALANCVGNYFLVPIWGAKGAAISTGLSYVILFALRTFFSNCYYKVNFKLKKFIVSGIVVYFIAILNSFKAISFITILSGGISVLVICVMYRNILKEGVQLIRNRYIN